MLALDDWLPFPERVQVGALRRAERSRAAFIAANRERLGKSCCWSQ